MQNEPEREIEIFSWRFLKGLIKTALRMGKKPEREVLITAWCILLWLLAMIGCIAYFLYLLWIHNI